MGKEIDVTKCRYNSFDGGGSQRAKCALDNKYCEGIRIPDCYYKQLQQKLQELKELKAYFKELNNFSATYAADSVLVIAKYKQAIEEVKKLASEPYSLPCCGNCKYPNCFDKVSKYGKNCMELKLMKIKEICSEVQK